VGSRLVDRDPGAEAKEWSLGCYFRAEVAFAIQLSGRTEEGMECGETTECYR